MEKQLSEITEEELKQLSEEEITDLKVEAEELIQKLDDIINICEENLNSKE